MWCAWARPCRRLDVKTADCRSEGLFRRSRLLMLGGLRLIVTRTPTGSGLPLPGVCERSGDKKNITKFAII
ncbi:hypothetical protein AGR9A_Lc40536 [Agrobacterium salinitolerans str. Hayward 0363]|nr:hypothetical protein AGR9A_Lc40536 [Agrobacterium salinitolerans str. Hayward 0363]